MKIKYLLKDQAEKAKLLKEEYEVLAYGQYNDKMKIFLFPNDELEIYDMDESSVEIVDNDLSQYSRMDNLNAGNELFIKNQLVKYLDNFYTTGDIKSNHIWNRSKIANFFLEQGYEIPELYHSTILNENYKINLLNGYLKCFNTMVKQLNKGPNRHIDYYFSKSETKLGFLKDESETDIPTERIPNINYNLELRNFLSEVLTKNENVTIEELLKLIDSLFLNHISSIFKLYPWGEETISIKYENNYYSIRKMTYG